MIAAKDLTRHYDEENSSTRALQSATFSINEGEFVAIMGPSGSGKSTLLHILGFLDRPTGGSYSFFGKKIEDLNDKELARTRNKEMGFVFQSFNLLARSSVYENVALPLLYSDVPVSDRAPLVEKAVASVGLTEKLHAEAGKLSGGQKQRVAIARALVLKPKVIFADEPTGNLDSGSGAQVMRILKDLHNQGHTIILVTHETYTAEFAERLIRLKDGRIESDERVQSRQGEFIK